MSLNTHISKELIFEAQKGNSRAMNKLIELCIPNIRYSIKNTIDYHTKEDIVQEICIRIMNKIDKFKYDHQKFLNWVSVMTKNFVLNLFEEKKTKKNAVNSSIYLCENEKLISLLNNIEEPVNNSNTITMDQIREIVATLPKYQREVFTLYYFKNMKHREIAVYKNITESTSKSNLRRAKQAMQIHLTKLLSNS